VYDFALFDLFLRPYGLLRIGQWLTEAGWRVRLVDCLDWRDPGSAAAMGAPRRTLMGTGKFFRANVETPEPLRHIPRHFARYGMLPSSIRERLGGERPDVILVSSGMTYWYPGVAEAVRIAREVHPRVPVGVGGVYASLLPAHCANVTQADFVVKGEAYPGLARELERRGLPAPSSPPRDRPMLDRDTCTQAMAVRLNSGCPMHCRYCASALLHPGFVVGDPLLLWQVVQGAFQALGTRRFAFYDDALLVDKREALFAFLDMAERASLGLAFHLPNAVHVSGIDGETARRLFMAGFAEVRLGFESSGEAFHLTHDRKLRSDALPEAVEALRTAGFPAGGIAAYVMAGLPGQGREEVETSVRFAASCGARVLVSEYSPVPGTALWEESVRASRLPLADEPLCHNNSVLPLEWAGFTMDDLDRVKSLARCLSTQPG
jgi:radical SAM superfamily enzyme YgiQ (UPF0313 family)